MNILFLNTSDYLGGAAIAARRLSNALNKEHVKVVTIVRDKKGTDFDIIATHQSPILAYNFLSERIKIWVNNLFTKKNLFAVSIANRGSSIVNQPEFKNADIIHLHWINQGFLSLKEIGKIIESGKPIVWTMHDMWPITGICHHARSCIKYTEQCENCPFLVRNKSKDLSFQVFEKKKEIYSKGKINFVGCSNWLTQKAKNSNLTIEQNIINIPNPIDTEKFQPINTEKCRKHFGLPTGHKLILFGAAKTTNKRKGIQYFINACLELIQTTTTPVSVVLYGKDSEQLREALPLPTYPLGYISDESELIMLYNAVDTFVLPSLEENLPNSIMEAMSCGTPCVGFDIGGIPELIDHLHNGYIAQYKSSTDLAQGIRWVIENNIDQGLSQQARRKVINTFSENLITQKYISLYNQIIDK